MATRGEYKTKSKTAGTNFQVPCGSKTSSIYAFHTTPFGNKRLE